jgi:antitoxin component YwqK of YwqJK toxin-antitoxin module
MGSFDQGKMTAKWTGWFPNGKMSYEGNYERDMKIGNWKFYTSKGKLKDDGNFKVLNTKEGENTYVFTEIQEQSYKQGSWKSYSEIDGKIASEGNYNRGRQSGSWKYYYPGGKMVAYENSYNNKGKLDGVSKTYSRRGKLNGIVNYKNGLKHGDVKTWDSKGKTLIQHLVYKNGVKVKDELNQKTFKYK